MTATRKSSFGAVEVRASEWRCEVLREISLHMSSRGSVELFQQLPGRTVSARVQARNGRGWTAGGGFESGTPFQEMEQGVDVLSGVRQRSSSKPGDEGGKDATKVVADVEAEGAEAGWTCYLARSFVSGRSEASYRQILQVQKTQPVQRRCSHAKSGPPAWVETSGRCGWESRWFGLEIPVGGRWIERADTSLILSKTNKKTADDEPEMWTQQTAKTARRELIGMHTKRPLVLDRVTSVARSGRGRDVAREAESLASDYRTSFALHVVYSRHMYEHRVSPSHSATGTNKISPNLYMKNIRGKSGGRFQSRDRVNPAVAGCMISWIRQIPIALETVLPMYTEEKELMFSSKDLIPKIARAETDARLTKSDQA
ncbi:hypothetical protein DFH09DRAFT_1275218 [Mycena vulgaris]|nr:hypothetical protein DFH09DRAFT_1275218 [Mycena vulgaris]